MGLNALTSRLTQAFVQGYAHSRHPSNQRDGPQPESQPTETQKSNKKGPAQGANDSGTRNDGDYRELNPTKGLDELSPEEKAELRRMQQKDREIRMHEAAHYAAGAQYVRSSPKFRYKTGPDGKRYVDGGEVIIDGSKPMTPEEAVKKAEILLRAALAPAKPSAPDRAAASRAKQMAREAEQEIAKRERAAEKEAQAQDQSQAQDSSASAAVVSMPADWASDVQKSVSRRANRQISAIQARFAYGHAANERKNGTDDRF